MGLELTFICPGIIETWKEKKVGENNTIRGLRPEIVNRGRAAGGPYHFDGWTRFVGETAVAQIDHRQIERNRESEG